MTRREIIERAAGVIGALGLATAAQPAPSALKTTAPALPAADPNELTERTPAGTWTDTREAGQPPLFGTLIVRPLTCTWTDTRTSSYTTRSGGAWAEPSDVDIYPSLTDERDDIDFCTMQSDSLALSVRFPALSQPMTFFGFANTGAGQLRDPVQLRGGETISIYHDRLEIDGVAHPYV